jgi:hypothetical protein
MLRIVLIAAGVVTTAVTGWLVKRKFSRTPEEMPGSIPMPQLYRPSQRRKRTRRGEQNPVIKNGESGFDPVA